MISFKKPIFRAAATLIVALNSSMGSAALAQSADEDLACKPAMTNVQSRDVLSLGGAWQYILDPLGEINRSPDKTRTAVFEDVKDEELSPNVLKEYNWEGAPIIDVPGSWNTQVPELSWYDQWMWMRRGFESGSEAQGRKFIYFEAVNYESVVYLNGEKVGTHLGGFTPFCFEVTDLVEDGNNVLVVGVNAEQDEKTIPPKRADWTNYGGITRDVYLIDTPETFVKNYALNITDSSEIVFKAVLNGPASGAEPITLSIPELGVEKTISSNGQGVVSERFSAPEDLKRWSPSSPKLYDVAVSTGSEIINDRIGFRTISTENGEILLNGEPIFLRGISLHEETLGTIPDRYMTEASAKALLLEIKDGLNGNFVRLAHYPHSEVMTRAADELGLLVWSEIPVYWDVDFDDEEMLSLARQMQAENVHRDMNRASVIIWSVANETLVSEERNNFLKTLIADTREMDSSRLITMASHTIRPNGGAIQFEDPVIKDIDLVSVNYYVGWYSNGPLSGLQDIQWANNSGKPMLFSEFGAGAKAGFHSDENRKFSEEFQADYYDAMLDMASRIKTLSGTSPWILKDFKSPRRFHPIHQDGWNRKGIIAPTGQRKLAFDVLSDWYQDIESGELVLPTKTPLPSDLKNRGAGPTANDGPDSMATDGPDVSASDGP